MIIMDLAVIAGNIFGWGKAAFDSFSVTFGDLTINGWLLLIGGAVVMLVVDFLGRIFQ